MTEHTPGPWWWETDVWQGTARLTSAAHDIIVLDYGVEGPESYCLTNGADGPLLKAAPDLLLAALAIKGALDSDPRDMPMTDELADAYDALKAAIDKALEEAADGTPR